jgi:RimJ/RimL family protein N-acetyltransferase
MAGGAAARRPSERLEGAQLVLARWQPADLPALSAEVAASRRHLSSWLSWAGGSSPDALAAFIRESEAAWQRRERFGYGIWAPDPGRELLGGAGLMARLGPGRLEIGYWVGKRHTRRRIATRATALLTAAAFELPGIERVEIHHDEANTGSAGVPRLLGFGRVGTFPRAPGGASAETGRDVRWCMRASEFPGSAAAAIARGA